MSVAWPTSRTWSRLRGWKNSSPTWPLSSVNRGVLVNPEYQQRIYKSVKEWNRRTGNIFFWEYYLYTWLPWREMPVIFPHLISQDLRTLRDFGKGEFIESESWVNNGDVPESMHGHICFPGTQHLNLYVTAKMYWNSRTDVDDLLDEYYTRFYGAAGAEMKDFWTTAQTLWMSEKPAAGGIGSGDNPTDRFKPSDITNLCGLLNDGLAKVEDGSIFARRIRLIQSEVQSAFKRINNLRDRKRSQYTMPKVGGSIKLGGVVDQFPWNRMDPVSFTGKTGEAAPCSTLAFGAWSSTDLYLTFVNFEPEMSRIRMKVTAQRRERLRRRLGGSVPLSRSGKARPLLPFHHQCRRGFVGRRNEGRPDPADSKWNSGAEVKVLRESRRWIAQIRIPLNDLGLSDAKAGRSLAANFYRNRYCGKPVRYMAWSPSLEPSHFCPRDFGLLHFGAGTYIADDARANIAGGVHDAGRGKNKTVAGNIAVP